MKAKVLLIPLIIVIAVAFLIGWVYPAFTNGSDGVLEKYKMLKNEQNKLVELQNKSQAVNNLLSQLTSLPEKNILYAFVPEATEEEKIVNSLINTASSAGVLLMETTINQPNQKAVIAEDLEENSSGGQDPLAVSSALPKADNFETQVNLIGSYEKIKDFLTNIGKLNRNNNIDVLKISKNNSENEESANADSLLVSASIEFNLLKKIKMTKSYVNNEVFSGDKLEVGIINEIKSQKNANNYQLNIDQKGKSNPFQL